MVMTTPKGPATLRKALLLKSARKIWQEARSPQSPVEEAIEDGNIQVRRKSRGPSSSPRPVVTRDIDQDSDSSEEEVDTPEEDKQDASASTPICLSPMGRVQAHDLASDHGAMIDDEESVINNDIGIGNDLEDKSDEDSDVEESLLEEGVRDKEADAAVHDTSRVTPAVSDDISLSLCLALMAADLPRNAP
jgi:hypothetical protein